MHLTMNGLGELMNMRFEVIRRILSILACLVLISECMDNVRYHRYRVLVV